MRSLQNGAVWVAASSATLGASCVIWYLSVENPKSHALVAAQAAAALGVAAIVLCALMALFQERRHSYRGLIGNALRGGSAGSDCTDGMIKRRELLRQRLEVDEPKKCAEHPVQCTCWSFCAGAEDMRSALAEKLPEGLRPDSGQSFSLEAPRLSARPRDAMDTCPHRYASPLASSRSTGDEPPKSPAS